MKQMFRHISVLLSMAVMVAGCNIWSDYDPNGILSELTISVTVSDTPGAPLTRAGQTRADINPGDYISPAHNGEKMQSLRIVIVRENGIIEHNRYIDFDGRAYMEIGNITFKVYGPEKKMVYLFVNENTVKPDVSGIGTQKLVDYDLESLTPESEFPASLIDELKISVNDNSEEVPSYALPMSESHQIQMPAMDHRVDLYVTRVATKFTYIFDNQTSEDFDLTNLTINKGSNIEYYIPRITYSGDPLTGEFEVSEYNVPNLGNNNYYSFRKAFSDRTIAARSIVTLDPIYLLEGKYTDAANEKNYSMSVTLNETVYEEYFPDVPQLPRNTHVVVVITLRNHEIEWIVDVCPYGEYWLYPDFGI